MTLTPAQEAMVLEAINDGHDFPNMTSDPIVNCEVDRRVVGGPSWEELNVGEMETYIEEAGIYAQQIWQIEQT